MAARSVELNGRGGYAKSSSTREAIVGAAFPVFAARGLDGAKTREIAEAAGVNQPAINYHFGSKEKLYFACAEVVVKSYSQEMGPVSEEAASALSNGCSPEEAHARLSNLFARLTEFLVCGEHSQDWVGFIVREMSEQGEAARVLHKNIWQPGSELVALLIQAAWGEAGQKMLEEARLEALMLISNLVAFTNGRPVSMRILEWEAIGTTELEMVKQAMVRRVKDAVSSNGAVRPMGRFGSIGTRSG